MRADRLVSILLLLQEHGRLSASRLAARLEVSVRTICRDMDALSSAGIPVCADPGPKGGYFLLDNYTTDLTGLKAEELLSLFVSAGGGAARLLGLTGATEDARGKLFAALPDNQRGRIEWYRQRLLVESNAIDDPGSTDPALVQQAVFESRFVHVTIAWPRPDQAGIYRLAPLGLIAADGEWWLAARLEDFVRVYSLRGMSKFTLLDERFDRPDRFDLPAFWRWWRQGRMLYRSRFTALLELSPALLDRLKRTVSEPLAISPEEAVLTDRGMLRLEAVFERLEQARGFVLQHGAAVRVIAPEALKQSVLDFARNTIAGC